MRLHTARSKWYTCVFLKESKADMNLELLKKAHERIPSVPVLVNLVSKRMHQLINGEKPLIRPLSSDEDKCDTALREIAEGKLISEIDFDAIAKADEARTRWSKRSNLKSIYID